MLKQIVLSVWVLFETLIEKIIQMKSYTAQDLKEMDMQSSFIREMNVKIILHDPLTPREIELARLIACGSSTEEISKKYDITTGTVKNYKSSIYQKLGIDGDRSNSAVKLSLIWAKYGDLIVEKSKGVKFGK